MYKNAPKQVALNDKMREPMVHQRSCGAVDLSWNPDDNRFYLTVDNETVRTFAGNPKGWANAVFFYLRKVRAQAADLQAGGAQ